MAVAAGPQYLSFNSGGDRPSWSAGVRRHARRGALVRRFALSLPRCGAALSRCRDDDASRASCAWFCGPLLVDAPVRTVAALERFGHTRGVGSQEGEDALVVEWIQCLPPKEAVQVRFLSRAQKF